MAQIETTVEVTLDDFDDTDIATEYRERGLGDENEFRDEIADIRRAVAAGDIQHALILIDRLTPPQPNFTLPKRAA